MKKKLRSGYTTGACAAAAAKAAAMLLLGAEELKSGSAEGEDFRTSELPAFRTVEIPFPDGSRVEFKIHNSKLQTLNSKLTASASVIKDAGDDPDVTHGAEIAAEARIVQKRGSAEARKGKTSGLPIFRSSELIIKGGKGVGTVTKPGLSVPVGEAAINPVPRRMIEEAVRESLEAQKRGSAEGEDFRSSDLPVFQSIEVTISVPDGEELAKKTLNARLGITGGISILGTTGIVKPVSTKAWTATIASSMDVARATEQKAVVVSAGRASEKAHMKKYRLPEEAYVLMGDYLEFALNEAVKHEFREIHLCAQWAKMVKIAMATPQTHVRFGAINIKKAAGFLHSLGINVPVDMEFNTAREIFDYIQSGGANGCSPLHKVCNAAKSYAAKIATGITIHVHLVSYSGEIITGSA